MALHDGEHIVLQIFGRHEPGRFAGTAYTADAQALPLAERVINRAMVLTNHASVLGFYRSGLGWYVLREEFAEASLANETDAR